MSELSSRKLTLFFRNRRVGYSIHRVFSPLIPLFQSGMKEAKVVEAPAFTASPLALLRNLWKAFRNYSPRSVCHVTGDVHYLLFALPFARKVITIHDLVTLRLGGPAPLRWLRRRLWFSWVLPLADRIVCISEKTRYELLATFPIKSEKVEVIPNPIDPVFQYVPKDFCSDCPRILHIGTNWNKNVERTVEALEGIPCIFVIVGALTVEQQRLLERYQIRYEQLENLDDQEMKTQYEACDIVSFPSLFEGFGMPIIEGQAVGRPVLTSSLPPLTEVAADAACYVQPEDVASIREGFLRLISDASLREKLIERGLRNVTRFQPACIAEQYMEVYRSL